MNHPQDTMEDNMINNQDKIDHQEDRLKALTSFSFLVQNVLIRARLIRLEPYEYLQLRELFKLHIYKLISCDSSSTKKVVLSLSTTLEINCKLLNWILPFPSISVLQPPLESPNTPSTNKASPRQDLTQDSSRRITSSTGTKVSKQNCSKTVDPIIDSDQLKAFTLEYGEGCVLTDVPMIRGAVQAIEGEKVVLELVQKVPSNSVSELILKGSCLALQVGSVIKEDDEDRLLFSAPLRKSEERSNRRNFENLSRLMFRENISLILRSDWRLDQLDHQFSTSRGLLKHYYLLTTSAVDEITFFMRELVCSEELCSLRFKTGFESKDTTWNVEEGKGVQSEGNGVQNGVKSGEVEGGELDQLQLEIALSSVTTAPFNPLEADSGITDLIEHIMWSGLRPPKIVTST